MQYDDMIIEAFAPLVENSADGRRLGRFQVRVRASPAGSMPLEQAMMVEYDDQAVQARLGQLEARSLMGGGLVEFGRLLSRLLLPSEPQNGHGVRELFAQSMTMLGPDRGLRLKLQVPASLALLPWEYLYLDRAGGGGGMDGFVVLDRRVALVRHEDLPAPPRPPLAPERTRLVVALASAAGLPVLDLARERADLASALQEMPGVSPTFLDDATLDDVQSAITGATVFHFAGHGVFAQQMGEQPGRYEGVGQLAFDDQRADAPELGILLRGAGVRLAVLGGCETGRRDGVNVWSGTASALLKAELPAVVANQFKVLDKCAIAFSKQFYQALLVGGLSIEQAVSAGRIAAYLADREGRDWGATVLYMRAADGRLFGGVADEDARRKAVQEVEELIADAQHVDVLVSGERSTGIAGNVTSSTFITGDSNRVGDDITATGSQGFINRPSGPIAQTFGPQHNVNTGGGDYAEGNIDRRQGAFVGGGTVYGPVVGSTSGTITTSYGGLPQRAGEASIFLQQVLARVQQVMVEARHQGNDDLADDLGGVAGQLEAALKAEQGGKIERRTAKLREGQASLRSIAAGHPDLQELVAELERVI